MKLFFCLFIWLSLREVISVPYRLRLISWQKEDDLDVVDLINVILLTSISLLQVHSLYSQDILDLFLLDLFDSDYFFLYVLKNNLLLQVLCSSNVQLSHFFEESSLFPFSLYYWNFFMFCWLTYLFQVFSHFLEKIIDTVFFDWEDFLYLLFGVPL